MLFIGYNHFYRSVVFLIGYLKMQGCLLGLEFAGLDSTGQRVMGLLSAKGTYHFSHFNVDSSSVTVI